ncbi:HrcA family transcriptional regulator [Helicobacter cholecystus]|uniref:HrcA family transcriptional regulator n=1 Tax=Helicobacter cholecystus TaxID=45498 RepID=A0A3D8IUU0_9HELI|nr:HrcA family transcriptional regulator [Helicobacter cholecystus]RDU68736.1 HrcA family transcriptional regulator [Helicobacter cholecystus]VEJ26230.1 heat shock regulator [Helicobacter cholecystus]
MSKRKQTLLKYVVEEYLESGTPIGSQTLKTSINLSISSATIRNGFKALMDEGFLLQPHISSGRIPSFLALKDYWRNTLELGSEKILSDAQELQKLSAEIGCFVASIDIENLKLKEVENFEDKFLVLKFNKEKEVLLRYVPQLFRFLNELVGMDLEDIQSIAHQVHAKDLLQSLVSINQKTYFHGAKYLSSLMEEKRGERLFFEMIEGRIFERLSNGIYFEEILPKGYILFIQNVLIEEKKSRVLFCGTLDCDYRKTQSIWKGE